MKFETDSHSTRKFFAITLAIGLAMVLAFGLRLSTQAHQRVKVNLRVNLPVNLPLSEPNQLSNPRDPAAQRQAIPDVGLLPGQHPWPMLGQGHERGALVMQTGPISPVIEPLPWPYTGTQGLIESAPIVASDGTVYFGDTGNYFYAVDQTAPKKGRLLKWRFEADRPIRSAAALKPFARETEFFPASPVRVYVTDEAGHVYSLNTDGTLVWDQALTGTVAASSAPAVYATENPGLMRVYLATSEGIYAIEELSDTITPSAVITWHTPAIRTENAVALSPRGERLYATHQPGALSRLTVLTATNKSTICHAILEDELTAPVVDAQERVYIGSYVGALYIRDARTCDEVHTSFYNDPITYALALAPDDHLVFISGDVLYMTTRDLLTTTWRFTPTALTPSWDFAASPVVDGMGNVYLAGTDGRMHAVRDGQEQWNLDVSQHTGVTFTDPAIGQNGRLYVGTDAGNLRLLQTKPAFQIAFAHNLYNPLPPFPRSKDAAAAIDYDIHAVREIFGQASSPNRLSDTPNPDIEPAYNTRGTWLAFSSQLSITYDVFIGTSGGQTLQNLTQDDADPSTPFSVESNESDPAFSPTDLDGHALPSKYYPRYLAVTTEENGRQLYFINLDVWEATEGADIVGQYLSGWIASRSGSDFRGSNRADHTAEAAFAPDGNKLAYSACTDQAGHYLNELVVLDLYAEDRYIVTQTTTLSDCLNYPVNFSPAFAPDSAHLVYQSEGQDLWVTDMMTQPGYAVTASSYFSELRPSWSPDGTELVYNSFEISADPLVFVEHLYTRYGPRYITNAHIVEARSFDPVFHPRRLPVLNVMAGHCNVTNTLQPARQQPRQTLEVRGCGFDIRFPENNDVYFPHVENIGELVAAEVKDAWVDDVAGVGVLEVEVPDVAGDGQLIVDTPFGEAVTITDTFQVQPLALDLHRDASVPGARIRILGYGFEPDNAGGYSTTFASDSGGRSAATVTTVKFGACDLKTPCPSSAGAQIGWAEVYVPDDVAAGTVEVSRHIAPSTASPGFSLLNPSIYLSNQYGSAGFPSDPNIPIKPVTFTISGRDFPYDPYFDNYDAVELTQADAISPTVSLTTAPITLTSENFSSVPVEVQPNSGGRLTITARMSDTLRSTPIATTTAPFTTPWKDLPIIFVPGTSGTYLRNKDSDFTLSGQCVSLAVANLGSKGAIKAALMSHGIPGPIADAVADAFVNALFNHHDPSANFRHDYEAGENVWMNSHTLLHVMAGCDNWLDVLKLQSGNNNPVESRIEIGDVMREVNVGWFANLIGSPDQRIYSLLIDHITGPMNRAIGDRQTGVCPQGNNCLYLFNEDWRMDMESQAVRLETLINNIRAQTGKPKVVIVTQSYGGPTTQYYLLTRPDAANKVDQVISLGGGYMGVVKPYQALVKGMHWGLEADGVLGAFFKLKKTQVQDMARDWPTAYWQLPQADWFNDPNKACGSSCAFIEEVRWDADGNGSRNGAINNAAEAYHFIQNAPARNPARTRKIGNSRFAPNLNQGKFNTAYQQLLNNPAQLNGRALGDWRNGSDIVFYHRIVGWGQNTPDLIHYASNGTICTPHWLPGKVTCINLGRHIKTKSGPGDGTIPLRSAVGILNDFDPRIWGLDGKGNQDYDGDGSDDADALGLHSSMARIPSVLTLIDYTTQGKLTDITQVQFQDAGGCWPDQNWPFSVPQGVPNVPSNIPQGGAACTTPLGASTVLAQDDLLTWEVELLGNTELHIYDAQGRHTGPVLNPSDSPLVEEMVPVVDYDRDPNITLAYLPANTGIYTFTLQRDETDIHTANLDVVMLHINALQEDYTSRERYLFFGVPISNSTTARLVWDTAGPAVTPTLALDYNGTGEIDWPADAILTGTSVNDIVAPTPTIQIENNLLTITAQDVGGSGVHSIFYGTGRGQEFGHIYTQPIELPPDTPYIWATAMDSAGNVAVEPTVSTTCDLPADFDGNGVVEVADLQRTAGHWLSRDLPAFDLNATDYVDVGDVERVSAVLGENCPNPTTMPTDTDIITDTDMVIRASTEPMTVTVGQTFTVDIAIDNPENLGGFEAGLSFNPGVLDLIDVTLTNQLAASDRTAALLAPITSPIMDGGTRIILFGAYSYGDGAGLSAGGVVAQVVFEAVAIGDSDLDMSEAYLSDIAGELTLPAFEGDTIHIQAKPTCHPVLSVAIMGPTTGTLDTPDTFTATVGPATAMLPITYTWSPMPDSEQNMAIVSYTWHTTGTQTLSVTVRNCGGSGVVSDVHTINIVPAVIEHDVYLPLILKPD